MLVVVTIEVDEVEPEVFLVLFPIVLDFFAKGFALVDGVQVECGLVDFLEEEDLLQRLFVFLLSVRDFASFSEPVLPLESFQHGVFVGMEDVARYGVVLVFVVEEHVIAESDGDLFAFVESPQNLNFLVEDLQILEPPKSPGFLLVQDGIHFSQEILLKLAFVFLHQSLPHSSSRRGWGVRVRRGKFGFNFFSLIHL